MSLNSTQRAELAQVIEPGLRRIRIEHIKIEEGLEHEEENTPSPLASCTGTEPHNKV